MASSDFCFNSSGIAIATSSTGWNKLTRSYDGYLESYDEWLDKIEYGWGFSSLDGRASCGGVLRDHNGNWVAHHNNGVADWLAKLAFDASFDVVTFDEPPTEMVPGLNLVL
ncbi:hypothetical protein V6N11_058873 [Hibiscus sabdariffa]|uniref:Uncharacterized protein n=1 Tax=Hibiscus sabdariffa TaxID=183260 RepID=A0ABR2U5G2_9ROSI